MRILVLILSAVFSLPIAANDLSFQITGIRDGLLSNAQASIANLGYPESQSISEARLERTISEAEKRVLASLRPLGYYQALIESEFVAESQTVILKVEQGPAVTVIEDNIRAEGPGAQRKEIVQWLKNWPLPVGTVLNQTVWESSKQEALNVMDQKGFLDASFTQHRIEIDTKRNEAKLLLLLETGPRAVMGEVTFEQEVVKTEELEHLVRFESGQPYDNWLIDRLRHDLWQTGFYSTIEIREERVVGSDPPIVNLKATLLERNRDTWQTSVGFGSDTQVRAQLNWNRHWLSDRGDSLGIGLGWQQRDNRYLFRTNYRLPRGTSRRSYWIADTLYRDEQTDFQVSIDNDPDQVFELTDGDIQTYLVKAGMQNIRDVNDGYQQITETWFVQYLRENVGYQFPPELGNPVTANFVFDDNRLFVDDNSSIALGVEWDWPVISGQGFQTVGHHQQLRMFTADDHWGSSRDFSQVYFSSRWNFLVSENFKVLLRGEVGYSSADVDEFELELANRVVNISLTDLPNEYRFNAGGSQSVRGYAYESLSNNAIGSNNLITFSAEGEWQFRQNWSVAAFYDIGNAFNDWSETNLRQGAGLGIRWYSIAGAVRLDFASALDLPGDPWRIHFTLGVPLL